MKKHSGGQNKHIKLSKVGTEQAVSLNYLSTTEKKYKSTFSYPLFRKVSYFLYLQLLMALKI